MAVTSRLVPLHTGMLLRLDLFGSFPPAQATALSVAVGLAKVVGVFSGIF